MHRHQKPAVLEIMKVSAKCTIEIKRKIFIYLLKNYLCQLELKYLLKFIFLIEHKCKINNFNEYVPYFPNFNLKIF